jgi:tetratricopeptide (TPR) repeat protein
MSAEKPKKFSIDDFITENQKSIVITAIVLILGSGGLYYNHNFRKPKMEEEANTAAYKAELYFNQDSIDLAVRGDGVNMGLTDIAEQFSNTKTGDRAAYLTGSALLQKGEYEEALSYLDKAKFSDDIIAPLSMVLKGDCYSELENYEKAATLYMKAANYNENEFTTPYALRKAATVYMELGNWAKAYEAFNRIYEDYDETRFGMEIEKWVEMTRVKAGL